MRGRVHPGWRLGVVALASMALLAGCASATSPTPAPTQAATLPPSATPSRPATPTPSRTPAEPGIWGRLASPGFENERIKTSLFFAGQARDGSSRYGCDAGPNLQLYTVHPSDGRELAWSADPANRDYALGQMADAGLNVVSMSSWGEDFLPCATGWVPFAPMQTAPGAHDELFTAAAGEHLLIVPFIESRGDWALRDEFPRLGDGRPAPGTVSQIENLISRYLKNPAHPEWAAGWAQVYDRNLESRYAVTLIHASSNLLAAGDDEAFAAGLDLVADKVLAETGVRVGFFLDTLPPSSNAPGAFKPSPEKTGPALAATDSILGIQSFIPEIWISGNPTEAQIIAWKRDYSSRWSATGVPFLMDVSPGYDASVVFPGSRRYGFSTAWQDAQTAMVRDFGQDGLVFNSWNGYTEGMAAVPTTEYGDRFYRWLGELCREVDGWDGENQAVRQAPGEAAQLSGGPAGGRPRASGVGWRHEPGRDQRPRARRSGQLVKPVRLLPQQPGQQVVGAQAGCVDGPDAEHGPSHRPGGGPRLRAGDVPGRGGDLPGYPAPGLAMGARSSARTIGASIRRPEGPGDDVSSSHSCAGMVRARRQYGRRASGL